MKMYVTSRFDSAVANKADIEQLCLAVRASGYIDFSFIRDIEQFDPDHFRTQKEVWDASLAHLRKCDALLVDVSDIPSGGRIVEVGMAFALEKPIYVVCKSGVLYKNFYRGVAAKIIEYEEINDITEQLKLNN